MRDHETLYQRLMDVCEGYEGNLVLVATMNVMKNLFQGTETMENKITAAAFITLMLRDEISNQNISPLAVVAEIQRMKDHALDALSKGQKPNHLSQFE